MKQFYNRLFYKWFMFIVLITFAGSITYAADKNAVNKTPETKHQSLVIQISTADESKQHLALSNVYNLQKFYGMDNIDVEVVAYGPGISLLYPDGKEASRVRSLMLQNVTFTGCQNTLDTIKAKTGKEPELIEDVDIVRAGISRILELQDQGYKYLYP